MISKHIVEGSLDTTLHDFQITSENMILKIEGTYYTIKNVELFSNYVIDAEGVKTPLEGATIDIVAGNEYQIYLTSNGIEVLYKSANQEYGQREGELVEKLAWFSVPSDAITLDTVDINVVEVVENASN